MGKHHWFPKRYIRRLARTHPEIYHFLDSLRLLICRRCEDEIHPENEWYQKFKELKKNLDDEIRRLLDRQKDDASYVIELKESTRKLNTHKDLLQQKIDEFKPNKEINQLQVIIAEKNTRIANLAKQLLALPKIEKELARYKLIVKNMNKNKLPKES